MVPAGGIAFAYGVNKGFISDGQGKAGESNTPRFRFRPGSAGGGKAASRAANRSAAPRAWILHDCFLL